ncbi:glutamate racemase [Bacterioplanes sanyensis]|uniref:glutamate racemase n=1 Tax=Bacterioplanes sanyensis TaxID=1249553 RepID=UPI001678F0A2|nr:glutamate racemase [Bacterioplanes sanyensis]GGY34092.1 glutamate racemase [Bacterioplanes sanyensis]
MTANILVFDSGVGGLSVTDHLVQQLPNAHLFYLMDRAFFPYGQLADEVLQERVVTLCQQATLAWHIDLIVIACNTASTLVLPSLRQRLQIPVVGVVPAVKVAAQLAQGQAIGVLATPATVQRPYLDQLIKDHAGASPVHRLGSAELVQWAEQWVYQQQAATALPELLGPWIERCQLRHVVLGCTHFPLLTSQLQQHFPEVRWIDSGAAIARRVSSLLPANSQTQVDAASVTIGWAGDAPDQTALQHFLTPWQRPLAWHAIEQ